MKHKAVKIGITAAVLAVAFGMLLYTTLSDSLQYYKYVDEVVATPHEWQGKSLQVHGYVVPGSRRQKPNTLEYRFDLQHNGKVIRAYYSGVVPDNFKDDAEVVLTGHLRPGASGSDEHPTFDATDMTAKCPSKYDEAPPAGTAATRSS